MTRAAFLVTTLSLLGPALATAGPRRAHPEGAVALARACVRRAGAQPERSRAWLRRIHVAAWLPELRLGAERDLGTREAIDPQDRTRYATYSLDELRLEVRASWRLDRLLFDPEEVRATRESIRLAELRQELALTVVRLYYERRRLQLESEVGTGASADAPPREAALRAARIEEIGAALEALCGVAPGDVDGSGQDG